MSDRLSVLPLSHTTGNLTAFSEQLESSNQAFRSQVAAPDFNCPDHSLLICYHEKPYIGWKVYLTTDLHTEITRVFIELVIIVKTNLNLIIVIIVYTMTAGILDMTLEGLGKMFEGYSAETCAGIISLVPMGV